MARRDHDLNMFRHVEVHGDLGQPPSATISADQRHLELPDSGCRAGAIAGDSAVRIGTCACATSSAGKAGGSASPRRPKRPVSFPREISGEFEGKIRSAQPPGSAPLSRLSLPAWPVVVTATLVRNPDPRTPPQVAPVGRLSLSHTCPPRPRRPAEGALKPVAPYFTDMDAFFRKRGRERGGGRWKKDGN